MNENLLIKYSKEVPFENPLKKIKFDLAHNIIYHESVLSLQRLAFIKVAISLWQHIPSAIIYKNVEFTAKVCASKRESLLRRRWRRFEGEILKKMPQLNLPESFKEELQPLIKMVGHEMFQFFEFEARIKSLTHSEVKIYLANICWTFQGTIDKTNTALRLIKHPGLGPIDHYILACDYCLIDEIRKRIQDIPVDVGYENDFRYLLPFYFFLHLRGNCPEVQKYCSDRSLPCGPTDLAAVFEYALVKNNEVAIQYIWEKLADREMKSNILQSAFTAVYWKNCDTACFLIAHMNESEVAVLVKVMKKEFNIFELLLKSEKWSFMFMPFAKYVCHRIWNFCYGYVVELLEFCRKIGFKDERYENIYNELSIYVQINKIKQIYNT